MRSAANNTYSIRRRTMSARQMNRVAILRCFEQALCTQTPECVLL